MCRRMWPSMILKNLEAALVEMVLIMPWLDRSLVHSAARKLKILKASGRPVLGLHAPLKNPVAGSGDPAAGHTEGI